MHETCYCGWIGEVLDREAVRDGFGNWNLRCPACGHLDDLRWLPEGLRVLVLDMARQRPSAAPGALAATTSVG